MDKSTEALLEQERVAYKIVQAARDEKNQKMQDAQFEAKQELAIIKQKMNTKYDELKEEKEAE